MRTSSHQASRKNRCHSDFHLYPGKNSTSTPLRLTNAVVKRLGNVNSLEFIVIQISAARGDYILLYGGQGTFAVTLYHYIVSCAMPQL